LGSKSIGGSSIYLTLRSGLGRVSKGETSLDVATLRDGRCAASSG
jgi:hypothetical protein